MVLRLRPSKMRALAMRPDSTFDWEGWEIACDREGVGGRGASERRGGNGEEGGEREAAAGGSGSGHAVRFVSRAGLRRKQRIDSW